MRRLLIIVTAVLLLAAMAAPATAKRNKPDEPRKPAVTMSFGEEPWAEYQPQFSLCVADVGVNITNAGKGSLVVFEALLGSELLQHSEVILPAHRRVGLLFSYDVPCNSEIDLEVTHRASFESRKGNEFLSIEETRLMSFTICDPAQEL